MNRPVVFKGLTMTTQHPLVANLGNTNDSHSKSCTFIFLCCFQETGQNKLLFLMKTVNPAEMMKIFLQAF